MTVIVSEYVPAVSPLVATDTVAVTGPDPVGGLIVSQDAVLAVDQLKVPEPLFEIPRVCAAGSGPPIEAVNESADGLTTSVGDAAELPYADRGPSEYVLVPDQVAGSAVMVVPALATAVVPPPAQQRSRNLSVPVGPSSAIQYAVPAVTGTPAVRATMFQALAVGLFSVPEPSIAPGLPAASA